MRTLRWLSGKGVIQISPAYVYRVRNLSSLPRRHDGVYGELDLERGWRNVIPTNLPEVRTFARGRTALYIVGLYDVAIAYDRAKR